MTSRGRKTLIDSKGERRSLGPVRHSPRLQNGTTLDVQDVNKVSGDDTLAMEGDTKAATKAKPTPVKKKGSI